VGLAPLLGDLPVTGCEGMDVCHGMMTRNGTGLHVHCELVMGTSSGPPSSLLAGDNGSVGNVRKASTFAPAVML